MGDRDELEAALARVDALEDQVMQLHAANEALEASLRGAEAGGAVEAPGRAASTPRDGAPALRGDAYRDDVAAAVARARALGEELVELRRANIVLAARAAADAEAREARERARRIEAAEQREAEAAQALARREHDRLARRAARVRPLTGPLALAAGLILGGAVGLAGAPAAGAVVGVIALLCTLALLLVAR